MTDLYSWQTPNLGKGVFLCEGPARLPNLPIDVDTVPTQAR
jgi:hypothetical protein